MAKKIRSDQAQIAVAQITEEIHSLNPSAICVLYEIDLSKIKKNLNLGTGEIAPDVLRFHNMEALTNKKVSFRSETYHALPITMTGFEITSNASLPRPTMYFSSLKGLIEEAVSNEYYASLKKAILELDNLIGAKVTRIRTFSRFLDASNNIEEAGDFDGTVNPEFPKEIYYVQRKISEDKNGIQLELSSVLDLENFKLPGRICVANRCPWVYRGEGCCYEFKSLGSDEVHGATDHLPDFAAPIANDEDDNLTGIIIDSNGNSLYDPSSISVNDVTEYDPDRRDSNGDPISYNPADVVYIKSNADDVKYYYVAKVTVPNGISPPHSEYWAADRCSKSMRGCKFRWGNSGAGQKYKSGTNTKVAANPFLPFGGFPGTNTKISNL
ncbi:phage minor tail protein L [bacterium]|nr:phage minor tail protein L [bacterium]|tara:strand:- start:605 stop:1753 length:1149 start_codon:yes stop_codon:yes gene_type:complete